MGIDWDSNHLNIYYQKNKSKPQKMIIKKPAIDEVSKAIQQIKTAQKDDVEIHALIEDGAKQWVRLLHFAGVIVYVVNPRKAKRFKESVFSSMAKDDCRDAYALMVMIQAGVMKQKPWKPDSKIQQKIDVLANIHHKQTKEQTRIKQKVRSYLQTKLPLIKSSIRCVDAKWVIAFFEKVPSIWDICHLTKRKFNRILSNTRISKQQKQGLWTAIQHSDVNGLSKEVCRIEGLQVQVWMKQLGLYRESLKQLNDEITKTLDCVSLGKRVKAIGGMGDVTTLLLLHCVGVESPTHRDDYSIMVGSSPVFIGSGTTRKGTPKGYVRMRKTVSSLAKGFTYMLGLLLMKHSRWARAMYVDGSSRGQSAGTITRRISRCFLRIVSSMHRYGSCYDEDRYIRSLLKNGVPWAKSLKVAG